MYAGILLLQATSTPLVSSFAQALSVFFLLVIAACSAGTFWLTVCHYQITKHDRREAFQRNATKNPPIQ